jgi:transposase
VALLEDALACRDARLQALEARLGREKPKRPYPLMERLRILWLIEYFQVHKRRVRDTFGAARSTVHRRLQRLRKGSRQGGTTLGSPRTGHPRNWRS